MLAGISCGAALWAALAGLFNLILAETLNAREVAGLVITVVTNEVVFDGNRANLQAGQSLLVLGAAGVFVRALMTCPC